MIVFSGVLTVLAAVLTAVGWSSHGVALVVGPSVAGRSVRGRALAVSGDAKLVWAWVLLLAVAGGLFASELGTAPSTVIAVSLVAAYAFVWCAGAALVAAVRSARGAGGRSYRRRTLLGRLGVMAVALAVGVLLLAWWMSLAC
ncbi:hypothetical protein [Microbacterium sp. KR10-403]|uniref:hypothetical protein n=1 Tax=Microbacterium sp. KR10-403 TaxID=3158581 RepID=UPI0032E4B288